MSWLIDLAKTYDNVWAIRTDDVKDATRFPCPKNHMKVTAAYKVNLNIDGTLRGIEPFTEEIIIPCSEKSKNSRKSSSHPLHEQFMYLSEENRVVKYLNELHSWEHMHEKVKAVHAYVEKGTIVNDFEEYKFKSPPKSDSWICFSVSASVNDRTPDLWRDNSVIKAWQDYCSEHSEQDDELTFCYVTGEKSRMPYNNNHAPVIGAAKLVSIPSDSNFITWQGRFDDPKRSRAIGADVSEKAHNMLKYLIDTQCYYCDSQRMIIWDINDGSKQLAPIEERDEFDLPYDDTEKNDNEKLREIQSELGHFYARKAVEAFYGKPYMEALKELCQRDIAVIVVDKDSKGRIAINHYNTFAKNEYIKRLTKWHETCCWRFTKKGKDCVSSPSADKIIAAVYGEDPKKTTGNKSEGYDKIKKQARERILSFILNGEKFDKSWLKAAVNRVSNPFSYDKQDGGWDIYKWRSALDATCAMARKYYSDKKEEFSLELERTRTDRDYLYGRMLAVADKIESYARYLQDKKSDTDKRPTNAVRYTSAFATKPFKTWALIFNQLNPYIQRLNGAEWYQRELDEIMSLFKEGEYESDKPLNGKYLMGYSLQRRSYNKNNEEVTTNEHID